MFEDLIAQLDGMGVEYTEDYDAGTLTIDVGVIDKVQLISVIQSVNDAMLPFTIDENSLVITGGEPASEEPMEEEPAEEMPAEQMAMDDMFGK